MTSNARGALVWPAMILTGLALGGYAFGAWPDTTPVANSDPTRVDAEPGRELASAASGAHSGDIFVYELQSSMLIDSIMATPQPVDAH